MPTFPIRCVTVSDLCISGEKARLTWTDDEGRAGRARDGSDARALWEWNIGVGGSRSPTDSFSVNAARSLESGGEVGGLAP